MQGYAGLARRNPATPLGRKIQVGTFLTGLPETVTEEGKVASAVVDRLTLVRELVARVSFPPNQLETRGNALEDRVVFRLMDADCVEPQPIDRLAALPPEGEHQLDHAIAAN